MHTVLFLTAFESALGITFLLINVPKKRHSEDEITLSLDGRIGILFTLYLLLPERIDQGDPTEEG
jgi:hypothetical protein